MVKSVPQRQTKVWMCALGATVSLWASDIAAADDHSTERTFKAFADQQQERIKRGERPLTLLDLVNTYPLNQKSVMIRKLAESQGPFFPIEGRWNLIDDASVALAWAVHEPEPFEHAVLDVLAALLLQSKNQNEQKWMAALLYRYDQPVGRKHLLSAALGQGDVEATTILALNQDSEVWPAIKTIFVKGNPSNDLIYALGHWDAPEATELLSQRFLTYGARSLNELLALSMLKRTVSSNLLKRIEEVWKIQGNKPYIQAAIGLIRFEPER